MTKRHALAAVAAFILVGTACGQYSGVHEKAFGTAPGGVAAPGTIPGSEITGTTTGGTTTGGTIAGPSTGGSTSGGPGTSEGPGGGSTSVPTSGDATGVTATTITIGIHAPLTGAAPLRAESFSKGKDMYWQKGNNGQPVEIGGRTVKVVFEDDQYNPSHAKDVCQKMAEQDKAFLLIGGGGTDQTQSCAQFAASRGIPYLSAGVTELQMSSLQNYFALSMSYKQQGPLLAQYIQNVLGVTDASRVAAVITDTPNFDDAVQAFVEAFPGVTVFRPAKNERGSSMAGNLCAGTAKTYDVVYPLTAPTYYLEMAGAAKCKPQYTGIGVSMGLDSVADLGCTDDESTEGARFFSPAPAFADTDDYDPLFREVGGEDDIMFLLWGVSKSLHQLFDNALEKGGGNLSREGFIAATSEAQVRTGVYPDVNYTPEDHFGADQVHVLRNECTGGGGHYVTEAAFKSSF